MEAKLQRFKIQPLGPNDDDLTVEHGTRGQLRCERRDQLRKISAEILPLPALNEKLRPVLEDERAEPVPLWFENPIARLWQAGYRLCQHRRDRRL